MKAKIILALLIICGIVSCDETGTENVPVEETIMLYDKPSHIIQKHIQGRWKHTVSYGGAVGISHHENSFIEFNENICMIENDDSNQISPFTWKKMQFPAFPNYGDRYNNISEIYVLNGIEQYSDFWWWFDSIGNDTLSIHVYNTPLHMVLVRVK